MADDLLATPLNKLPPPAIISKAEGGGTVSAVNYNDLRDSITIPTADDNRYQQSQQQQQHYYEQPQQQQYYDQQQPMTPGPQHSYYEQQQQPIPQPQYAPSIPPPLKKKKKKGPFFSTDTLKDKKLWLFAVVVFLLYTYGLPKLYTSFPSMVDPMTSTLKSPAVATASVFSGLVYMFVSEFL